jgi:hypothetical protein
VGSLHSRLDVGPSWGVAVAAQPLSWMGAEARYSGAVHELGRFVRPGPEGNSTGADFVRNGGALAVTFNAPTPLLQPYALAGVGFDRYDLRGPSDATFKDDTSGRVPLGAGVRGGVGAFVADARFHYDVLFSQQFARTGIGDDIGGGYTAMLNLGGRF